jgi:Tfp pilus assembly protein PilO
MWPIDVAGAAALLVVTAMAWLFVARPQLAAVQARSDQRQSLARRSVEASNLQQSVVSMQQRLAELERQVAESPSRLRSVGDLNQQTAAIGDIAASCGLEIDQLEVGAPQTDGDYRVVSFLFEARGSYTAAARFLHRLQQSVPGGAVTSFDLSGNPGRVGVDATFRLRLAWFALPDPTR